MLAAATWAARSAPRTTALALERALLAEAGPEVVFVGNSTTREGIDEAEAERRLGVRVTRLWTDGSGSALWWLYLKNVVAAATPPPRVCCILFRDHELTNPTLALTGAPGMQLRALMGADEPELDRLGWSAAFDPIRRLLARSWPLYSVRDSAATAVDRFVRDRIVGPLLRIAPGQAGLHYWLALSDGRMDPALLTAYQQREEDQRDTTSLDFDAQVGKSYLPEMVETARAAGVTLVLVRIRTRRDARGIPMPGRNRRFGARLGEWCAGRGVPLIDHRNDEALTPDLFGYGDHLTKRGAQFFTERLCDEIRATLGEDLATGKGPVHQ